MDCMFCGETPDTEEHIIPKWLQNRYSLQNQILLIPNGTELQYKFAKIPVKNEHNNQFGKIEQNISQGIFNLNEVYLWALKIHIGMLYRDSSLKYNIRIPNSSTILDINEFSSEVIMFRLLYNNWRNGGETTPNPLGSVYVFDSLMPYNDFDFIHCLETGTICLNIGDKFITVFLWDQSDGYNSDIEDTWNNHHKVIINSISEEKNKEANAYLAQHVWACESSYFLYRHRRLFNFIKSNNNFSLVPPISRNSGISIDENVYRHICISFGLELLEFNGEAGNKYRQLNFEEYIKDKKNLKKNN